MFTEELVESMKRTEQLLKQKKGYKNSPNFRLLNYLSQELNKRVQAVVFKRSGGLEEPINSENSFLDILYSSFRLRDFVFSEPCFAITLKEELEVMESLLSSCRRSPL